MARYKVICKLGGDVYTQFIACREMTIDEGSYLFWEGAYGETNRLMWAFPVMYTIVEGIYENETK